ncbi:MAG TPA: Na+/H+ antiporter subunit D [Kiritimatiellia bacterium]|nr:Na+/H+ antiporter subunit D [Kiritimatiellia bacterium]
MNLLLSIPVALPLACALLTLFGRRNIPFQRAVTIAGSVLNLLLALLLFRVIRSDGILALQIGNWPAPYGITFVADLFSAVMLIMSGLMATSVAIYSIVMIDEARERFHYHVFFNVLIMGVNGAFLTGDLFNLYVWFETMLMASFVLLSLGGERPQLQGAIKYVAMNFLSSALFLAGVGIIYGITGTLNMADLAVVVRQSDHPGIISIASVLFLIAFGIKSAAFPLFFWLPASYHTPPSPVSAIFAGLLTKVGVYALIRVFTLIFMPETEITQLVILVMAGFTMVTGVLGAAAQMEMRRLLSFHIVSQIGYMIMGLGMYTAASLGGAVLYIVHNIIAKTNLFFVAGVVAHKTGTNDLKKLGGIYKRSPILAVLFLISAMALAGLPPLSGFFAKLSLVIPGLSNGHYVVTATAIAVGLLTLFSMTKIWNEVFWKPAPGDQSTSDAALSWTKQEKICLLGPVVLLAACSVVIGLAGGSVYELVTDIGAQLKSADAYIQAVLPNGGRVP